MKNRRSIALILIVLIVAAIAIAWYESPVQRTARADAQAKSLMSAFGARLKNVPLTGDDAAVTKAIDDNYASYVTPQLLADWEKDHSHAPGRLTSSPWPDRVSVETMTTQGTGRLINGEVIMVTSADQPGESEDTVPYIAQLVWTSGGWKIAAFEEQVVQTLKKIPTSDVDIPGAQ